MKPTASEHRSIQKLFRRNDSKRGLSPNKKAAANKQSQQVHQGLMTEIARVSELRTQMRKRMNDFDRKSPR